MTEKLTKYETTEQFAIALLLCIIGIIIFSWWFGIGFFGDYCGDSDAYRACHSYGVKCVSGGSCGWACQKMANVENRSVYCECPCELCTKPTCLRKTWYPESWGVDVNGG